MNKYIAPEADIYKFCLTDDILEEGSKTYSEDNIVDEEVTDPFS